MQYLCYELLFRDTSPSSRTCAMPGWVRVILAVGAGLMFIAAASGNLWLIAQAHRCHRRTSLVPLVGGLCGALAVAVVPIQGVRCRAWVPLVLD